MTLDRIFSLKYRRLIYRTLAILSLSAFIFIFFAVIVGLSIYQKNLLKMEGIGYITGALFVSGLLLESFFRSYYFKDVRTIHKEFRFSKPDVGVSYAVGYVFNSGKSNDITVLFFQSYFGKEVLFRLGIFKEEINLFLSKRKMPLPIYSVSFNEIETREGSIVATLDSLARFIYENDSECVDFLLQRSIQKEDFLGASTWVEEINNIEKTEKRWWSKDSLGKIPSIGKDWDFGKTFVLQKFAHPIKDDPIYKSLDLNSSYGLSEEEELENILIKNTSANAMIVGDYIAGMFSILARLGKKIESGRVSPTVENKKLWVLDVSLIFSASQNNKAAFEENIVKIFNDAVQSGNVILAIDDLPALVEGSHAITLSIEEVLRPFLHSDKLQLIALADKKRFHEVLETNIPLLESFEKIMLKEKKDEEMILGMAKDKVAEIEKVGDVYFTFQAIKTATESALRFFAFEVLEDKLFDILIGVTPKVLSEKRKFVLASDVSKFVFEKTGVPQGDIGPEEKDKLLRLEELLRKKIIGQEDAVLAISQALRRSRAGVASSKRPMGVFLFLGPTGVGKTETAKALASVFFGGEASIMRLDMSEFNNTDGVSKLIGSFGDGSVGILTSMLREKQYGVILLDEFEKASKDVHDIFLQIFDEGFFTDARGKKVNARNTMIIATSNAGSDMIWQIQERGEKLGDKKDTIVESLISQNIYRPELLNRFDGVILFHTLNDEDLTKVAQKTLGDLERRLKEKGVKLIVDDALLEFLKTKGFDKKFGARPMIRVVQDSIEDPIARKMITGEIKSGSSVHFIHKDGEYEINVQ
jgi:ATP-dependent Clp protease ATP-binding subunit ClpA